MATNKEADAENAEGADASASAPSKLKKWFSRKILLMALGGVFVLGGGGGGAYFFFKMRKIEKPVEVVKPVVFFDLPEVLVNLATASNERTQYLKVKIVLELPDNSLIPTLQPVLPRVIDMFQTYLRELRPTDLEGSAGLYRLRDELTRRVNVAIAPNHINAVLFKEIVVQ
ncbi:MAG TPA: flagellar basal body-associated FliL family protein [Xanthobacteraceae bacterium]|jgi:flagellar FliL protein|nr:flagellar basal body-associated FliL family protein [Xanthobacteraceae bacterium]